MTGTPPPLLNRDQRADSKALWQACIFAWGVLATYWIVDSLSIQTEIDRAGADYPPLYPWVIEGTSIVTIMLAIPAIVWLGMRFPLEAGRWKTSLPVHAIGFLIFGAYHITLMILLREVVWKWGYGGDYDFFFSGGVVQNIVYELRKDFATYIAYQLIVIMTRNHHLMRLEIDAARREARRTQRLTLKSGGRTLQVDAQDFLTAKAAGNYVEVRRQNGAEHLVRTTLAELEQQLGNAGIDAVRVHRSWVVNRAQITEIAPTGEGDVRIALKSGDTVPGSRRYRDRLEAA